MIGLILLLLGVTNNPKKAQLQLIDFTETSEQEQLQECPGCKENNLYSHTGKYAKIMDWQTNKTIKFVDLLSNVSE